MPNFAKAVNGVVVQVIVAETDFLESFVDSSPGDWFESADGVGIGHTFDRATGTASPPPPLGPVYRQLRAVEYNLKTIGEQLAMQYDDAKNGTTTWLDWQDEIKARIPKP